MLKAKKFTLAFIAWMVFVTWASLATFSPDDTPRFNIPHFDKFVHFCFYLGAAASGTLFLRETTRGRIALRSALWYAIAGAIIYGILIEVLQFTLTLDRQGDFYDALANSCGALAGGLAMKWFFSSGKGLKWK